MVLIIKSLGMYLIAFDIEFHEWSLPYVMQWISIFIDKNFWKTFKWELMGDEWKCTMHEFHTAIYHPS